MQMHLDLSVPSSEEMERHRGRAEAMGATLVLDRSDDEDEPLYVLADPSGHPFCICVELTQALLRRERPGVRRAAPDPLLEGLVARDVVGVEP